MKIAMASLPTGRYRFQTLGSTERTAYVEDGNIALLFHHDNRNRGLLSHLPSNGGERQADGLGQPTSDSSCMCVCYNNKVAAFFAGDAQDGFDWIANFDTILVSYACLIEAPSSSGYRASAERVLEMRVDLVSLERAVTTEPCIVRLAHNSEEYYLALLSVGYQGQRVLDHPTRSLRPIHYDEQLGRPYCRTRSPLQFCLPIGR